MINFEEIVELILKNEEIISKNTLLTAIIRDRGENNSNKNVFIEDIMDVINDNFKQIHYLLLANVELSLLKKSPKDLYADIKGQKINEKVVINLNFNENLSKALQKAEEISND